ncbi:hypothetical protein HK098_002030 [Nowakowskiella sp. JEL0407]|nr:hypothetical protein HK098_002030 [Nowakowskiella sp. JEL0407]
MQGKCSGSFNFNDSIKLKILSLIQAPNKFQPPAALLTSTCLPGGSYMGWWCALRLKGCNSLLAAYIITNAVASFGSVRGPGYGDQFKFREFMSIIFNAITMTGGWRQVTDTIIKARKHTLNWDFTGFEINNLSAYETIAWRQRSVSWHVEAENNNRRDVPRDSFYAGVTDRNEGILICMRIPGTPDGENNVWRAMFDNVEASSKNTVYWMHRTAGELLMGAYLRNDPAPGKQPLGVTRRTTMDLQECQRLYESISLPSLSVETVVDVYNVISGISAVGFLFWSIGFSQTAGLIIHSAGIFLLVVIWRLKTYEWAGSPGKVIVTSATYQPDAAAYRATGDSTDWKKRRECVTAALSSTLYDADYGRPVKVPENGIFIETQTGRITDSVGEPMTFYAKAELEWIQKLCPSREDLLEHSRLRRPAAHRRWRPGDILLKRESLSSNSFGSSDDMFSSDMHQAFEARDLYLTARPARLLIRNAIIGALICGFGTALMILPLSFFYTSPWIKWIDFLIVGIFAGIGTYRSWKGYADLGYMEVSHLRPEADTNNWYMK